jgi:predicted enzyme related to lactoylglutathione lyase
MSTLGPLMEVILYAHDMAAQVAFWRDVMGLHVKYPADCEDYAQEFWVELEAGPCTLVLHGGGKREIGGDAPKVVFSVADVEAARQMLLDRGVQVGAVRSPAPGVIVADGIDPEGNKFSIEKKQAWNLRE